MRQFRVSSRHSVLVANTNEAERAELTRALTELGFVVHEAASRSELLDNAHPDLILLHRNVALGETPALVTQLQPTAVIVLLEAADEALGAAAIAAGARRAIPADSTPMVLASYARATTAPAPAAPRERAGFVWRSEEMRELEEHLAQLADSDCTVLILGETGTGKSWIARALHAQGCRRERPLVTIDCAALRGERVDGELFGVLDASGRARPGLFDRAEGGSILFDEVSDLEATVQGKVLKAVDERSIRPVGGFDEHTADVRVIATTHRDLLTLSAQERFRADLYYRISTFTLTMPPLRRRRRDLVAFAEHVLRGLGKPHRFDDDAAAALLEHDWPGNVRELRNVVERAAIACHGDRIQRSDLRFDRPSLNVERASDSGQSSGLRLKPLEQVEREHIESALEAEGGHVESAAKLLGVPRSTLYQKLKTFNLTARVHEVRARRSAG